MKSNGKCGKLKFSVAATTSILVILTLLTFAVNVNAQDVPRWEEPTISVQSLTVQPPELPYEFSISVYLSNVKNLTGLNFNLTFDPSVLIVKHVSVNESFASLNWSNVDNETGFVNVAIVIEDPITIAAPVSIAELRFEAIEYGFSPLNFTFAELSLGPSEDFSTITPRTLDGVIVVMAFRPENLLCAGFCHAEYVMLNNTDVVPNVVLNFSQSNAILGIFKEYNKSNLTTWTVLGPVIELYYNTSELYPPHKRGLGAFDAFKPTPTVEDTSVGYLKWVLPDITGNEPCKMVKAFDVVQTGLLSDTTDMIIIRSSQSTINSSGIYWTSVTVNASDCFRVKIIVILENNSYMDTNFTGYAVTAPPGTNITVKMSNKTLVALFERLSNAWNPTNGTFVLNTSYEVVKFTGDVIEYKPQVKVALRVRVTSDLLNNTFYINTYNTSLRSVLFDRYANFSSSSQQNWTTEEFKVKVVHLNSTFNVIRKEPDLVVIAKDEINTDNGYQIYYIIKNIGLANASAGHWTALIIDGIAVEAQRVPVELGPGDTYWNIFNTTIPYSSPPSDIVTVCADYFGDVDEMNESNNCTTNEYVYPIYTISGKVYYEGEESGKIYVLAFGEIPTEESIPISYTIIQAPGPYTLKVNNGTYYVVAFMDTNGNEIYDYGEPVGFAINKTEVPDKIVVSGSNVSGVDITLRKPLPEFNVTGNAEILWSRPYENLTNFYYPLVADLDNDGRKDIIFPTIDGIVAFRGYDGEKLWERKIDGGFGVSDVEFTDVNGDGVKDIILGDIFGPRVLAVNGMNGEIIWDITASGIFHASDILYPDLNGDGIGDVVVYGVKEDFEGERIVAISGNGEVMWAKNFSGFVSVSAGKFRPFDFDGNSKDDLIVFERMSTSANVSAIRGYDGEVLWTVTNLPFIQDVTGYKAYSLDDVTEDDIRDVAVSTGSEVIFIVSGSNGEIVRAIDNEGIVSPCIDFNEDGKCEFITYDNELLRLRMSNGTEIGSYEFGSYESVYWVMGGIIVYGKSYDMSNDIGFIKIVKLTDEMEEVWNFTRTINGFPEDVFSAGDLNNDGVTDLMVYEKMGGYVIAINGYNGDVFWEMNNCTARLIGDFNGDGKGDVFYGEPVCETTYGDVVFNNGTVVTGDNVNDEIFSVTSRYFINVMAYPEGPVNDALEVDLNGDGLGELVLIVDPNTPNSTVYVITAKGVVPKPDLTVEISVNETVVVGLPTAIELTVKNIGNARSNETKLNVYINENLVKTYDVPSLDPSQNVTFEYSYTFGEEGIYAIRAIVDPDNLNDEINEANNESVVEVEAIKLKPDLTVEISVSDTIIANHSTTINIIVKNIGENKSDETTLDLYVDNIKIETFNIAELNPSESKVIEYQYTFTEEGQHVIKAVVDPNNLVDEVNESNNETTLTVSVSPEPIILSFEPESIKVSVNAEEDLNIVINKLPNGLSGYNITITVENASVAEIVDVKYPSWAILTDNSSLPASSVWIKAVDLNDQVKPCATDVLFATITVRAKGIGNSSINISITGLDDDEGNPIEAMIINCTISVVHLQPLPGLSRSPTDPDGDGIFEDLNGNGRLDFDDVVKYFKYLEWMRENYPTELVDINGNGRVDFDDVVKLFKEV